MQKLVIASLVAVLVAGGFVMYGRTQTPNKPPEEIGPFMRVKLTHAQKVLEGLTLEDYDSIAKHSQKLSLLSLESNWRALQTKEYVAESAEFRRAANRLTRAAKRKNLDGATLAYVEVTMKCVHCHKYVRETRGVSRTSGNSSAKPDNPQDSK